MWEHELLIENRIIHVPQSGRRLTGLPVVNHGPCVNEEDDVAVIDKQWWRCKPNLIVGCPVYSLII